MNYILFDGTEHFSLLPLTYTRPVAEIRIGILKISEKWNRYLNSTCSFLTEAYLQEKFPVHIESDNVLINGALLPNEDITEQIKLLKPQESLTYNQTLLAIRLDEAHLNLFLEGQLEQYSNTEYDSEAQLVAHTWDIFSWNGEEIEADFDLITKNRHSQSINSTVQVVGDAPIFIEEGAQLTFCTLNTTNGPIYIGKDAEIMEGSSIRGPFALCDHSTVKMGAKIYGPTTIGPESKIGGELNNVVVFGYSNKAHDGFLGNSVIGEWCNLGADSNNSNLKNNYAEVRLWDYKTERFAKTGLQFCGLIMGDHSKCGINTMFNTGTVVGVSANIFGSGFPRNFVPSFSWGGAAGFTEYKTDKAFEVAEKVFKRRSLTFDDIEKQILNHVFDLTQKYRKY